MKKYFLFFIIIAGVVIFYNNRKSLLPEQISKDINSNLENNVIHPKENVSTNIDLTNVPENTYLFINSDMLKLLQTSLPVGSKILIKDYLGSFDYPSSAKIIATENDIKYLFTQYYSGGAHCCTVIEAYHFDANAGVYKFIDSYSFDGEDLEMKYPFKIDKRIEYFYSPYAAGGDIPCPGSNYIQKLHIIDNAFTFKAKGNVKIMEDCFQNYFTQNSIPEIANAGYDDGSREAVVNFLNDIYSINKNLGRIQELYFTYFPDVADKQSLWFEIKSNLTNLPSEFKKDNKQNEVYTVSSISQDNNISSLDCEELMSLVIDNGDFIEELNSSEMNSSALSHVVLYEYEGTNYVIAQYSTSSKRYIYCDISISDWNYFIENANNSYGASFDEYLDKDNCSCD